jgi:glucose-6-phosphate isomerase
VKLHEKPFSLDFSLIDGLSTQVESTKRYLSNMKGMFSNEQALEEALVKEDALVYEFYELRLPEHPGDLLFGTSIVYPGTVGGRAFLRNP